MFLKTFSIITCVVLAGCAAQGNGQAISNDHPASPRAAGSAYQPAPNVLAADHPIAKPGAAGGHEQHGHADHEAHATPGQHAPPAFPVDVCVVSGEKLGSMGKPVTVQHEGRTIPLCCKGCVDEFKTDPAKFAAKYDALVAAKKPSDQAAPSVQQDVDTLTKAYVALTALLAQDKTQGAADQLQIIRKASAGLASAKEAPVKAAAEKIAKAAPQHADNIEHVRHALKDLSAAVIELTKAAAPGKAAGAGINEAYCPHAKASWLQVGDKIANPYYGSEMLGCGKITRKVTAAEAGEAHQH